MKTENAACPEQKLGTSAALLNPLVPETPTVFRSRGIVASRPAPGTGQALFWVDSCKVQLLLQLHERLQAF